MRSFFLSAKRRDEVRYLFSQYVDAIRISPAEMMVSRLIQGNALTGYENPEERVVKPLLESMIAVAQG